MAKKQLFEQQVSRAELFDCAKEHELSHLQQQANQAQKQNKRECQCKIEISELEQLSQKKQKLFEQQISRTELFDYVKEHELSHLHQQANQVQLIQHTIGNEVNHLLQQAN